MKIRLETIEDADTLVIPWQIVRNIRYRIQDIGEFDDETITAGIQFLYLYKNGRFEDMDEVADMFVNMVLGIAEGPYR